VEVKTKAVGVSRAKFWCDFETGGLDVAIHSPLQFACVAEVDGKIVGEWNVSIRELPLVVTDEAMALTGIDLAAPGLSFNEFRREYWDRINRWFYGGTTAWGEARIRANKNNMPLFCGQNTFFDRPWLQKILGSTWDGIYYHRIDTMVLANTLCDLGLLKKDPDLKLGSLCKNLGVKVDAAMHDALVDVKATRACYEKMKELIIHGPAQKSFSLMERTVDACV